MLKVLRPLFAAQGEDDNVHWRDFAVICGLVALICALYWKTIFFGVPVSTLCRLANWDPAFAAYSQGPHVVSDSSLQQLLIPYTLLAARMWHQGQIPLWNPYNANGVPLLADPQSFALSPLVFILSACPTVGVYNRLLVGQFGIGAIGMFVLARSVGLNRISSLLVSLSFTFCPYIDRFFELIGREYMLLPLLFWLFVRSAKSRKGQDAAIAGAACALCIFSGHPEISFFGILFATIFLCTLIALDAFASGFRWQQRALIAVRQISIAALVAFCLAAPLLFPFFEYLRNSYCYKFADATTKWIPFPTLLLNLLQPAIGSASLYLGILPALSLPFCLASTTSRNGKIVSAVLLVVVASEWISARCFPVDVLQEHTLLGAIIPYYCQSIVLIFTALLAGFGSQYLIDNVARLRTKSSVVLIVTAVMMLGIPLLVRLTHIPLASERFDPSISAGDFCLLASDWLKLLFLTAAMVIALLCGRWLPARYCNLLFLSCLTLSVYCQFSVGKAGLPEQYPFNYPMIDPVQTLSTRAGRFTATSDDLLRPASNALYNLYDLRSQNPLWTLRFRSYMQACHVSVDRFTQVVKSPISPALGLASISNIVSQGPVYSSGSTQLLPLHYPNRRLEWPGLQLKDFAYAYDPVNRQLVGRAFWEISDRAALKYKYSLSLAAEHNPKKMLWSGDRAALIGAQTVVALPHAFDRDFGVCVPLAAGKREPLVVTINVYDEHDLWVKATGDASELCSFTPAAPDQVQETNRLSPTKAAAGERNANDEMNAAGGESESLPITHDPNFVLSKEFPGWIRIYENRAAVPRAYLVNSVQRADTPANALQLITSKTFNPWREAVVECNQVPTDVMQRNPDGETIHPQADGNATAGDRLHVANGGEAMLVRTDPCEIVVRTASPSATLLVLTDTFYPGWEATVDGKVAVVERANFLFRGVFLPPGSHEVNFHYRPLPFASGLGLSFLCLLVLLALFVFSRRTRARECQPA